MRDLFADIAQTAKSYPHSLALISKGGNLEYKSLVETIECIAGHAIGEGLTSGQIVHVETENDDMRFLLFLGLMRAGMTVALLQSIGQAFVDAGFAPDVVVTDRSEKSALAQRAKQVVRFSRDWFRPDRETRAGLPDGSDYGLIYASSGSTGHQKLIFESRTTINHNIRRKMNMPMFRNIVRCLPGFGETSHGTFPEQLLTLVHGGSIVRLRRYLPPEIVVATCLLRPSYIPMAPALLIKVLKVVDDAPRRFRKVDYVRLHGGYCAASTRKEALEKFAQHVITAYGSTETGLIAWGDFADIGETEGSVGWVSDGMSVEAIDGNGHSFPPGVEGEIRVKPAPEGVTRYLDRDGFSDVLSGGWFYPGDIGRIDASGQLIITGRKSTVINLGGNKINPEVAESELLALEGVEDVAVAPILGEHGFQTICALVVTRESIGLDQINRFLSKRRARFSVERLKLIPEIPRNPNRKIDRPAVQEIADSA